MANNDSKGKINTQTILAAIGGIAIGLVIGMAASKISPGNPILTTNNQSVPNQVDESIFNDQSALVSAKVKSISPTSITIENYNHKEATFSLNDKVFISKQSSNQKSVTATSSDIKVGEFVIINLKKSQGQYQVFSIIIPPPIGTPPPPPALSPKPAASAN